MRKVQYLEIKEWIARGMTTYSAGYIVDLIKTQQITDFEMIGGTYRIADNKANRKRLGNRERVKKSSKTSKNDQETT